MNGLRLATFLEMTVVVALVAGGCNPNGLIPNGTDNASVADVTVGDGAAQARPISIPSAVRWT